MTGIVQNVAQPRPPWGIWATLGWVILAAVLAGSATLAALLAWRPESFVDSPDMLKDGPLVSVTTCMLDVVLVGILALAARAARWPVGEYFGLVRPGRRNLVIAIASLTAFVLAFDAMTYLLGRAIVTPFQVDTYRSARDSGTLPLMWFAFVIVAPISEEMVFRGFLFRGWVRPGRGALPAILVISALFAIIHLQYDWFGITQVFLVGLALGWARWWSGSTTLTILMHALINLWATVQSMVKVEWLP
jgi:membrane protease YdiL (CAAX protease family)